MIGWEDWLYVFVSGAMFMLSVLGLESAVVAPSLDRWGKRFFTAFFAVLVLCSVTFFLELAVFANPAMTALLVIECFFDSLLSSVPLPMLAVYLLHCCDEDWRSSSLFRAMLGMWFAYFVMVVASQFTTAFYYITPNNQLHLGPAYLLSVAPILTMLILLTVGVIRRRSKLSPRYYQAFLICMLPVTLAVIVHTFVPSFTLVNIGLTISISSMYRIIESDSIEQGLRQQREIAHQRTSITVLQMRPHFIYNTMMSIYYLCRQDPSLAQQVTLDFTTYLRKNFTAIASEQPIPFAEELEHACAYLAVEQAQFEDALFVDYDTPHVDFCVPPLVLQPLVENAVKHGMDPDSGPLHILIRTRKTDSGSEVVVENTGAEFVPADDNEPHIALANIKRRLEMMCHGELTVVPRRGGGTVVTVTIP